MSRTGPPTIHGTCLALPGGAVLLRGAPGSGKSDLGLRLLDSPDTCLVADDRVIVGQDPGEAQDWYASGPDALHGLLEVRGLGIIALEADRWVSRARLIAVIDLMDLPGAEERLPESTWCHPLTGRLGRRGDSATPVRRFALWPFAASAPTKVRLAVAIATGAIGLAD